MVNVIAKLNSQRKQNQNYVKHVEYFKEFKALKTMWFSSRDNK